METMNSHPHFSLVKLDTQSKVMQQARADFESFLIRIYSYLLRWGRSFLSGTLFCFSMSASFLCYGATRIYFGGVWFCLSSQRRLCSSPPPRANVTYIRRWHRDPVCTPTNWQRPLRSKAQRRTDTVGFRRLHNLPRSLIHFNYFIIMQPAQSLQCFIQAAQTCDTCTTYNA